MVCTVREMFKWRECFACERESGMRGRKGRLEIDFECTCSNGSSSSSGDVVVMTAGRPSPHTSEMLASNCGISSSKDIKCFHVRRRRSPAELSLLLMHVLVPFPERRQSFFCCHEIALLQLLLAVLPLGHASCTGKLHVLPRMQCFYADTHMFRLSRILHSHQRLYTSSPSSVILL